MSEWKEYRLGEIAETNAKSLSKDFLFNEIEYLDTGSITCNKIESLQKFDLKNAPSRAKRLVEHEDIIYSTVRPNQLHYGFMNYPKENLVVSTGFVTITSDRCKIVPLFLYYYLTQKQIIEFLHSIAEASTSTYPSLKPSDLESLDLLIPPLPEQKAIASVLSSLDDKIDLLHRQNTTLEAMAETLFRQYFIEEAKEDWETVKLGDVAEIQNGYPFSSKDYEEFQTEYLEVLKMGHIQKGGGLRIDPKRDFVPRNPRLNRWILNKTDIVMAMTDMKDNVAILGVPAMIDKSNKYVLNQRVARIYLKDDFKLVNNYLLYIQLKDLEFIKALQSKANSGVQVNLSTDTIRNCEILIPPLTVQKKKSLIIEKLYLKMETNINQIEILCTLRDTLLPKLMSGEVKVRE